MTPTLLTIATGLLVLACGRYLVWLLRPGQPAPGSAAVSTILATALLLAAAALELVGSAGPTLGLGPRVLLLVTAGVCVLTAFAAGRAQPLVRPVTVSLALAVTLALAVKAVRGDLPPPETASMGAITVIHIGATLLGFLLFVPAFVLSMLFLHQQHQLKSKQPGSDWLPGLLKLENAAWKLVFVGFPTYSVGILLGFIWQERSPTATLAAPEHLLAAASWLLYATMSVRRLRTGWRGRRAAVTGIVAFLTMLSSVLLYVMR